MKAEKASPSLALVLLNSPQHPCALPRLQAEAALQPCSTRWIKYQAEGYVWLRQQPSPTKYLLQSRQRDSLSSWKTQETFFFKKKSGEGEDCVRHDVLIKSCFNDNRSSRTCVPGRMEVSVCPCASPCPDTEMGQWFVDGRGGDGAGQELSTWGSAVTGTGYFPPAGPSAFPN